MKKLVYITFLILLSLVSISTILYVWMNSTTFQVAGEIIPRVETQEKIIALTFDDGPNKYTDQILNSLAEKNVPATFYIIGEQAEIHIDETKKIVQAGHELGNHSYTHQRMIFKPQSFIASELERTNAVMNSAEYIGEVTFRPPYGKKLVFLPLYLHQHSIKTITWDIAPEKYLPANASSEQIVQYISEKSKPGSIILLHPWYGEGNPSRDAIPQVIETLQNQGFRFVTISELLERKQ